jgi:UDP-N-acetylmuramate--alanine ligase
MDADHLDVYGTKENLEETFVAFSKKVKKQLVVAKGIALDGITYAVDTPADYYATNIKTKDLGYTFDLVTPNGIFKEVYLNLIGIHNLSNAVASAAMAELGGLSLKSTLKAFSSFPGINRRMNVFNSAGKTIIDDYAHHPTEIKMVVDTLKERYSESKHAVIFQPHLFSRTQDFLEDFATILSEFDEVLLMDIYPARELPINGITSEVLLEKISCQNKRKILKNELVEWVDKIDANVIAVLGAGDIGNEVKKIKKLAQNEA